MKLICEWLKFWELERRSWGEHSRGARPRGRQLRTSRAMIQHLWFCLPGKHFKRWASELCCHEGSRSRTRFLEARPSGGTNHLHAVHSVHCFAATGPSEGNLKMRWQHFSPIQRAYVLSWEFLISRVRPRWSEQGRGWCYLQCWLKQPAWTSLQLHFLSFRPCSGKPFFLLCNCSLNMSKRRGCEIFSKIYSGVCYAGDLPQSEQVNILFIQEMSQGSSQSSHIFVPFRKKNRNHYTSRFPSLPFLY